MMFIDNHDLDADAKVPDPLPFRKRAFVALATTLFLTALGLVAITSTPSRMKESGEVSLFHRDLKGNGGGDTPECQSSALYITGVVDGPLSGGLPKAIELYAARDIADLSEYCLESPNNGDPTPSSCVEFVFPSGTITAGTYLHVASEASGFADFFEFAPDNTSIVSSLNGDDAVVLFRNDVVVDFFGEEATDGSGTAWEYTNGWAYRKSGLVASESFNVADWTFSGTNALDGETTNAAETSPFPVGTYSSGSTDVCNPTPPSPVATPAPSPVEGPSSTLISAVQGAGPSSTLVGSTVTVNAVVVGDFQTGDDDTTRDLGGFYVQEEDVNADSDPATSEGIFIYEGDGTLLTDVQIGDLVRVTGAVQENLGQTQIAATSVTVLGTAPLPTPAAINFPIDPVELEAFEGMRVQVSNTMTITEMFNLDRFNEIKLYAGDRPYQYTQLNTPDVDGFAVHLQSIAANSITYDDGLSVGNADISFLDGFKPFNTATTPRMGDTISVLAGVLFYSFGVWRIQSPVDGTNVFASSNPRPLAPPAVGAGNVTMTSFNVLNFFTTLDDGSSPGTGPTVQDPRGADNQAEFDRQLEKLVTVLSLIDADLLGLIELENDYNATNSALGTLVDAMNTQMGAGTYAAVYPGEQYVGDDVISVGFMYKPSVLTVTGSPAILRDTNLPDGSDPPIFDGVNTNRASLAVSFTSNGGNEECITVAANHFKSKGGSGTGTGNTDTDNGAGNWNQRRLDAAKAVDNWLKTDPTGVTCANKVILGDLNAYAMEDPIQYLIDTAGYINVESPTDYSYVFDGQLGTLDYILVSSSLSAKMTGSDVWHICEDEPDAIDYNLDFGRSASYFDGTSPARASDHSPVIVGLDL
jgi:predicted extracellular nuclease